MPRNPIALLPRRRHRLWLSLAGFYLGGAAIGALAILLGFRLVSHGNATDAPVVVAAGLVAIIVGIVCLALVRPARMPAPGDGGLPVDQAAEPLLVASVRQIAARVGVRLPLQIVITPGAGASCLETGPLLGRGRRCRVEIGMASLQGLTRSELEALLSMHLSHQADGDLRLRRELARALHTIERTIESSSPTVARAFRWYQALLLAAWNRYDEVHVHAADLTAARSCGGRRYADTLRRTSILPGLFEQFLEEEVQPILDEGYVPADLYAGFRLCLEALGETGQLQTMENEAAGEEAEGSFPSLGRRLSVLRKAALTLEPLEEDATPARELLREGGDLEHRCAAHQADNGEEARPLAWTDVAEHVWAVRFRSAAATMRSALPSGTGLAFVIDWLASPSQLALAATAWPRLLEEEMSDELRQSRARALVQRGVAGWIGEELGARGWRWDTSPGYAIELESPDGAERIAPLALLAPLGIEAGAAGFIRERLLELGLGLPDGQASAQRARALLH